ncbi:MAG: hypothetical protein QM784_20320 [Polyangiaceae bacterium]
MPDEAVIAARRLLGTQDCAGARAAIGASLAQHTANGDALTVLGQALQCLGDQGPAADAFFCAAVAYRETGKGLEWAPTTSRSIAGRVDDALYVPGTGRFAVHEPYGLWVVSGLNDPEGFPPLTVLKYASYDDAYRTCDGPVYVEPTDDEFNLQGIATDTGKVLWRTNLKGYTQLGPGSNCPSGKLFLGGALDSGVMVFERETGKMRRIIANRPQRGYISYSGVRGRAIVVDFADPDARKYWSIPDGRFLDDLI